MKNKVMIIPLTAVSYNLYGDIVYVVSQQGKDKKGQPQLVAKQRFVTLGERRNNEVQVLKGLNEGEQVVTAGQIKLHEGSQVVVNNKVNIID
jgi:membrane fusion protein (multidrug efflux system)